MKKLLLVCFLCSLIHSETNRKTETKLESEKFYEISNHLLAKKIAYSHKLESNHPFDDFCEKYQEIAIFCQLEYGVPVSIQLAQAIVESGAGKSSLCKVTNNLFGMKYYKKLFDGEHWTSAAGTKWRKYPSYEESFKDHAIFLSRFYSYACGKDWIYWVKNCKGYGANNYWQHIGEVIQRYELYKYDDIVDFSINFNKTYQI